MWALVQIPPIPLMRLNRCHLWRWFFSFSIITVIFALEKQNNIMNPIKAFRQLVADIKFAIDDPYVCSTEEGKQMWREIEELERKNQESPEKGESENKSSE